MRLFSAEKGIKVVIELLFKNIVLTINTLNLF